MALPFGAAKRASLCRLAGGYAASPSGGRREVCHVGGSVREAGVTAALIIELEILAESVPASVSVSYARR